MRDPTSPRGGGQWAAGPMSPREKWCEHVMATNMRSQIQLQHSMMMRTKLAAQSVTQSSMLPALQTSPRGQMSLRATTKSPRALILRTDRPPSPRAAQAEAPPVKDKLKELMEAAEFMRTPAPKPSTPKEALAPIAASKPSGFNQKQTQKSIGMAVQAVNSHFSNMLKAFKHIDLDNSGSIGQDELHKALKMWNVVLTPEEMEALWARCDKDGDGHIDYKEFVDTLARDTVAPAAMGKRDMQAREAMGVADLDPEFLGHKKVKNYKIGEASAGAVGKLVNGMASAFKVEDALQLATQAINSHFSNMLKAFKHIDLDNSGSIGTHELRAALNLWNVGLTPEQTEQLIQRCDVDGDGQIGYTEFVDALARDTVAPSAMGKRDMQAFEAMGVSDLDPEFLGHKHQKNYRMDED